jgi:hypothetical protein
MDTDIGYLLSLQAVRSRAQTVLNEARNGNLIHFHYDESRMAETASLVTNIITVCAV